MLDVRSAMRRSAMFHADLPAVTSGDVTLTFAQAWDRGLRLANGLLTIELERVIPEEKKARAIAIEGVGTKPALTN